ncbi:hypothetical protein C9E81_13150 [Paracoccus alkanivorans]|uniref:Uncharacterized protein n=1 Tax=Paracoccus alkanivorans TaxID=2116655 RepID=A0A3M0MB51_9RHOB|nr:hypothetical protein C9E81_13150 [Paracoccus alkanivorans]
MDTTFPFTGTNAPRIRTATGGERGDRSNIRAYNAVIGADDAESTGREGPRRTNASMAKRTIIGLTVV